MKFICLKYPRLEMTYKAQILREVNGVIMKEPTKLIKFDGGFYETEDNDEIAFIKRHVDFGNGNICVDESSVHQKPEIKTPAVPITVEESKKRGRHKIKTD